MQVFRFYIPVFESCEPRGECDTALLIEIAAPTREDAREILATRARHYLSDAPALDTSGAQ